MTNRYEDAMNDLDEWDNRDLDPDSYLILHETTIRSALQLAQETEQLRLKLSETAIHLAARNSEIEQLRKERDEFERKLKDRSEWFFRWIARGKAGYAGMSMEKCADMIWHHPDNPYSENNPWSELAKKVAGE